MSTEFLAPLLYSGAILITIAAGYQLYRQHFVSYKVLRDFLVGAYLVITALMALELLRLIAGTQEFMQVYAPLSIGLGLLEAILLAAGAVGMYLRPQGSSYRTFLGDLRNSRLHAGLFTVFSAFTIFAIAYDAASKPRIHEVTLLGGGQVLAVLEPSSYILLLAVILAFFIGYPTVMLFLATRRIPHGNLRESLLSLPIAWACVSIMYLLFEGLLWTRGIDATGVMYLLNAGIFFFVTQNFRNSALLAGHVIPPIAVARAIDPDVTPPTAPRLGSIPVTSLGGRPVLFEADASLGFEDQLVGMASTFLGLGKQVFVITSRGSRVHRAMSPLVGVKFYLLTTNVSSYKMGEAENEVLISSENTAVILDAIAKSTSAPPEAGTAIIFDSLSDLILSLGFQPAYKFMKAALEIVANNQIISVFVMLSGTHEKNVENVIMTRFPVVTRNDRSGLVVVKAPR